MASELTVGVFLWVLDKTISKKSAAVGTGAIALSPLVDILSCEGGERRAKAFCSMTSGNFRSVPTAYSANADMTDGAGRQRAVDAHELRFMWHELV